MLKKNSKKFLRVNRTKRVFIIYLYYVMSFDQNELNHHLDKLWEKHEITEEDLIIIQELFLNLNEIESNLIKLLPKNWDFNRINNIEKSILINGIAEIKYFNNDKIPVINESVEITKKYCVIDAPPLINAILDQI